MFVSQPEEIVCFGKDQSKSAGNRLMFMKKPVIINMWKSSF